MKRGLRSPLSIQVSPLIQGSKVPLRLILLVLHTIRRNSPNGKMDEGHILAWLTIQTSKRQNQVTEDFKQ